MHLSESVLIVVGIFQKTKAGARLAEMIRVFNLHTRRNLTRWETGGLVATQVARGLWGGGLCDA